MIHGNGNNLCNFACDDTIIKDRLLEKILGLTVDNNLSLSDHISNICKTTSKKLIALLGVSASMNSDYELDFWLIILLNLTWVTFYLFGSSTIEKVWKKVTKYKNIIYV